MLIVNACWVRLCPGEIRLQCNSRQTVRLHIVDDPLSGTYLHKLSRLGHVENGGHRIRLLVDAVAWLTKYRNNYTLI